jgi:hypothetical protein
MRDPRQPRAAFNRPLIVARRFHRERIVSGSVRVLRPTFRLTAAAVREKIPGAGGAAGR